jgi:hypothetical protein
MTSPIESMFAALPCTICRTPMNVGCGCWIKLECTGCGKTKSAAKDDTDPQGTAKIRMLCPECAAGDFSMIDYFDKDGRQLLPGGDSST